MVSKVVIELEADNPICNIKLLNELKNRTIESKKSIKVNHLLNILSETIEDTDEKEINIIPNLVRMTENRRYKTYYFVIPPQNKFISVVNRSNKIIFAGNIPICKTLIYAKLNKETRGDLMSSAQIYFYGLKSDQDYSIDKTVYNYPYLNVFTQNNICWGSTKPSLGKNINDPLPVKNLLNLYFESNFNLDLSPRFNDTEVDKDSSLKKIKEENRTLKYLKTIKDEKTYPDKYLISTNIMR